MLFDGDGPVLTQAGAQCACLGYGRMGIEKNAPVPGLGRERCNNTSWCHPISEKTVFQRLKQCPGSASFPLYPLVRKGAAPVSGPAGGAVFPGAYPVGPLSPNSRKQYAAAGTPLCQAVSRVLMRRRGGEWCYATPKQGKCQAWGSTVTGQRGPGWGLQPPASPGRPGPVRGSAARRWPRWWPWARSAYRTGGKYTVRRGP